MAKTVKINDISLMVEDFSKKNIEGKLKISFRFYVTSEEYHDITSLLYKNDFEVEVPEEKIEMKATIYNYSTSITNLYEENQVGEFRLELIEEE